ncbi:MAG: hypothetical protein AB8G22_06055 [Saprospiraceae bacterium]
MKNFKFYFTLLTVLTVFALSSCNNDEVAINIGADVTVTNTLQATVNTGGVETTIEELFSLDAGALAASATVSNSVEFPAYLLGLYDIDIDENSISFELVAAADDPTYSAFFRTLEAGTTDRYYLTFAEAHNIESFSSSNDSVNLRIDSDQVVVVEIGEGFDFNPGSSFILSLN